MFGRGSMGARRLFVPLRGFPMCVLHWCFLLWKT
jgi:hypothetical protein